MWKRVSSATGVMVRWSCVLVQRRLPHYSSCPVRLAGGTASSILDPWVWNVQSGGFVFKRTLPWLWHSGVIVTVIALLTPFITTYVPPPDTSKDESEADTSDGTGDDNASGCDLDADSSNDDHIGSVGISTPAGHKRVRLPAASSLPLNDGTLTCWVPASADQTAVQAVQAERARRRLRLAQFVVLALSRDRKQVRCRS